MLRSFANLRGVDLGFDPQGVLTFAIDPPTGAYPGDQARLLQERIVARIGQLPGVVAVGADRCAPLRSCMASVVTRAGDRTWQLGAGSPGDAIRIGVHAATPEYFAALRIPVRRGRVFGPQDREGTPRVVLISERAAQQLFPGQDPVGQRLSVAMGYWNGGEETAEIIGVVGNVKYSAPDQADEDPQVYVPALQWTARAATFMVRTAAAPGTMASTLREAVLTEAPDLAVYDVKTMEEIAADATAKSRFATLLLGVFAVASLILAAVGIYGVMSFAVAQRTRELGLRMALGARSGNLLGLVMGQGVTLLVLGTLFGLAGALLTTRALGGLLFGIQPTDLATFAIGVLVLAAVALGAVLIPALRAMRNDPMIALRYE
jgi:putative ABC transport system permease protein